MLYGWFDYQINWMRFFVFLWYVLILSKKRNKSLFCNMFPVEKSCGNDNGKFFLRLAFFRKLLPGSWRTVFFALLGFFSSGNWIPNSNFFDPTCPWLTTPDLFSCFTIRRREGGICCLIPPLSSVAYSSCSALFRLPRAFHPAVRCHTKKTAYRL